MLCIHCLHCLSYFAIFLLRLLDWKTKLSHFQSLQPVKDSHSNKWPQVNSKKER